MDQAYKTLLKKQGYHFVGEHSACKTCYYTANELKGGTPCYKHKFYGVESHRCIQMSVAVNFCNLDCVFCWRKRDNSAFGTVDDPIQVVNKSIEAHKQLLSGFGGHPDVTKERLAEGMEPRHFAISLNGENTAYPRLNEFLQEIEKKGHTSFLVTNGQFPKILNKLHPPTQLYLSLSAPNKELFFKIDKPLATDGWERILKSLDALKNMKDKTRTVIRITTVRGLNMSNPEEYGELIKRAEPKFVEVKGYSHLGAATERLMADNVPNHEEMRAFAKEIGKHSGYKIVDEQSESRALLLMQEDSDDRLLKF